MDSADQSQVDWPRPDGPNKNNWLSICLSIISFHFATNERARRKRREKSHFKFRNTRLQFPNPAYSRLIMPRTLGLVTDWPTLTANWEHEERSVGQAADHWCLQQESSSVHSKSRLFVYTCNSWCQCCDVQDAHKQILFSFVRLRRPAGQCVCVCVFVGGGGVGEESLRKTSKLNIE